MLKYSVQTRFSAILWVLKTIHKEAPMYAVLDKVSIKYELFPCILIVKRGFETKSCMIEIINAILYKLKTGCLWSMVCLHRYYSNQDPALMWDFSLSYKF